MANLQKPKHLLRNLVIKQNCAKKIIAQIATNYTFLKRPANSNLQNIFKIFKNLNVYSRKTDNVQILFKGVCAKICARFIKNLFAIWVFFLKAFQRILKC